MWWSVLIVGWLIFGLWIIAAGPAVFLLQKKKLQHLADSVQELEHYPPVSVIIPARDEAANIENCLRSLLSSDYPNLELIAIDDRSGDETGAIMDCIADNDERLKVIHITELPSGWLGKNYAMHVAASEASGEFLLFTDGDILFQPETIRLAVRYTIDAKLDHICLMPRMVPGSYWETALTSFFGLIFAMGTQPWLIASAVRRSYAGVGAFNLVRQKAYEEFKGHEPIRLDILDDVKLGKLVKQSGFRSDMLLASEFLQVRWQTSAWGVIRGLEKNAFASQDYSVAILFRSTLIFSMVFILPYLGACWFQDAQRWGYVAAIAFVHVAFGWISSVMGGGWKVLPVLPIVAVGMLFAFWRSAWVTLRQGGVQWRETFYSLELLRKNLYQ